MLRTLFGLKTVSKYKPKLIEGREIPQGRPSTHTLYHDVPGYPALVESTQHMDHNVSSCHTVQWTPSNPATLGTNQSVLKRGVASFQGGDLYCKAYFGTFRSGLNTEVATTFQGSRFEGIYQPYLLVECLLSMLYNTTTMLHIMLCTG